MTTQPPPSDDVKLTHGMLTPRHATRYKNHFAIIGSIELLLGGYMCLFGIAAPVFVNYYHRARDLAQYAGLIGGGVFLLLSGGLKKWRSVSMKTTKINLAMSLISAALMGALAALGVLRFINPQDYKTEVLDMIIAVVCGITMIICFFNAGYHCFACNVPLQPQLAVMYTNERTGQQQVVQVPNKKAIKKHEESFNAQRRQNRPPMPAMVAEQRPAHPMPHPHSPMAPHQGPPMQPRPGILKGAPVQTV